MKLPINISEYLIHEKGLEFNEMNDFDLLELERIDSIELNNNYSDYFFEGGCFKNLKKLKINGDKFFNLDLSENLLLEELYVGGTSILDINLKNNTNLVKITLKNNFITNLNTISCGQLEYLDCSNNEIESLFISGRSLVYLDCSFNNLKNLELKGCDFLSKLNFSSNKIKRIELNRIEALEELNCSFNKLEELDISELTKLRAIIAESNFLNYFSVDSNYLSFLILSNNKIKYIDCGGFLNLQYLDLISNEIEKINISHCNSLVEVNLHNNPLVEITLSKNNFRLIDEAILKKIKVKNILD